jgi:hypothetical protein
VNLLGKSVYTTYLFPFEATAALLIIAVVGAVVLARRPPVTVNPVDEELAGEGAGEGEGAGVPGDSGEAEPGVDPDAIEAATAAGAAQTAQPAQTAGSAQSAEAVQTARSAQTNGAQANGAQTNGAQTNGAQANGAAETAEATGPGRQQEARP